MRGPLPKRSNNTHSHTHPLYSQSAFHPGDYVQRKRYKTVTVNSMLHDQELHDMESVCMQHLLELM